MKTKHADRRTSETRWTDHLISWQSVTSGVEMDVRTSQSSLVGFLFPWLEGFVGLMAVIVIETCTVNLRKSTFDNISRVQTLKMETEWKHVGSVSVWLDGSSAEIWSDAAWKHQFTGFTCKTHTHIHSFKKDIHTYKRTELIKHMVIKYWTWKISHIPAVCFCWMNL